MREEVSKAVKEIYISGNHQNYLERCKSNLNIDLSDIEQLLPGLELEADYWNEDLYPSGIFLVEFNRINGLFRSKFMFSKLTNVFYVEHSFEVKNMAPDKSAPILDGFCGQAYIIEQFNVHEKIGNLALKKGYIELSFAEISEVICELSFPKDAVLFDKQVSVEYAIFHDTILDLCD